MEAADGLPRATDASDTESRVQATLKELKERDGVDDVAKELSRLWRAFQEVHGTEAKLVAEVREVVQEIDSCKTEVVAAKAATVDLQQTHSQLEQEVTSLADNIEGVTANISERKEEAAALRETTDELEHLAAMGPGWTADQKERKKELQDRGKELKASAEQVGGTVLALRRDLGVLDDHLERGAAAVATTEGEVKGTQADIAAVTAETSKLTLAKEEQDATLKRKQKEIDHRHKRLADLQRALHSAGEEVTRQKRALAGRNQELQQFLTNYATVNKRAASLTAELDATLVSNHQVAAELNDIGERCKRLGEEAARLRRDATQKQRLHTLCQRKIEGVEEGMEEIETKKQELERQKTEVKDTIAAQEAANHSLKRTCDDLSKEREILQRGATKVADRAAAAETLIQVHLSVRKSLEVNVNTFRSTLRDLRNTVTDLEAEVGRKQEEVEAATRMVVSVGEQLKLQELQEKALQRQMEERNSRLLAQQHMYETVRADRNKYNKSLVALQDEIDDINRRFKRTTVRVEQLKDEISAKDHRLVKEHFDHHRVEKEKDATRSDLARTSRHIASADTIIGRQQAELKKLEGIVQDGEEEAARQEKEFKGVVAEKDALRAQLNQRDAELTQLYEKLRLQRAELEKGGRHFAGSSAEHVELLTTMAALKAELNSSKKEVTNVDDFQRTILKLERELTESKAKKTALEEERKRPINVHRWRLLENTDPTTHSKLQRLQSLQKRVIEASEELAHKDVLIKEKESVYMELKRVLSRQPGPEVVEQLTVYQQNLKQKQKQLRAMELELQMHRGTVEEHKYAIQKLTTEAKALDATFLKRTQRAAGRAAAAPAPVTDYATADLWAAEEKGAAGADVAAGEAAVVEDGADLGALAASPRPTTSGSTHVHAGGGAAV